MKTIVAITFCMFFTSLNLAGQDNYLLDSLFARSVQPFYGIEDSLYFEYDDSNRLIKEANKYFYKTFSYDGPSVTTSFYNTVTDEKTGERKEFSEVVDGFGINGTNSKSYENGQVAFTSSDTSFIENGVAVRRVYWQSEANGNDNLLFEVNSEYTDAKLTSSNSVSYDNNQEILREEIYSAHYENDLIKLESNATSTPFSVPIVDSTFYSYDTLNVKTTILTSYRNGYLSYCVKNEEKITDDYFIRTSFESHNCNDFRIQDSIVQYLSDFPIVDYDSSKSYRFIDNEAQLYRFEQNTLYFDDAALTVEVFRENFFSNRLDGVFNEVNSSNSFYSLKTDIETLDEPNLPEWMMYPNPAAVSTEVQLEVRNTEIDVPQNIRIYNTKGELIESLQVVGDRTELPNLNTPGLYFIQLFDSSNSTSETRSLLIF